MLDVRRLRVLREVAQRGSFSAAAEALAYTQSAISQQVAALEREAGAQLVERSARGVRLTDAGRVLVTHADVILARLADAEDELQAITEVRAGRLRLAAFPSACATLMPVAITRFRERHPGVELSLLPREAPDAIELLAAGEIDVALTIDGCATNGVDPSRLTLTHLLDDPMYVALPKDHALARRPFTLADLADEQWMVGPGDTCPDVAVFTGACRAAGFEPRVAFESDDYLAIQGFVAAGMAVSFIPDLALVAVRDDVVIRSLGDRPPVRHIDAAILADGYRSPAKDAMLGVLAECAAEFGTRRRELALAS
jgi:DNA-binding transcriptional LysR family regulator